jgi:hypothetical protein
MGTAFLYQGRLTDAGSPADGAYDLSFSLYDAGTAGTQVGSTVTLEDVAVAEGLFTVTLDFGAGAFPGEARWLEIGVRPGASADPFTLLATRQELKPAPSALYSVTSASATAVSWTGVTDVPTGFADGVDDTVPTGAVMFFNLASCPAGWSALVEAEGRYLVAMPTGGTLGAAVGTALTDGQDRATGRHTHSASSPAHTHTSQNHAHTVEPHTHSYHTNNMYAGIANPGSGTWGWVPENSGVYIDTGATGLTTSWVAPAINATAATVTVNNAGAAGTNAPYLQLLACQKD